MKKIRLSDIDYDPSTGEMTAHGRVLGTSLDTWGYQRVQVDGQRHMLHRVAWRIYYGTWPENEIDHINRVKTDNRIVNLRDVDRRTNAKNVPARGSLAGKIKGVYKNGSGYCVRIRDSQGINKYHGTYKTLEEAARVAAEFAV